MIKNITSAGGLLVTTRSLPYINMQAPSAGMVRYNSSVHNMEVYDGTSWLELSSTANISLNADTSGLLEWARKKRDEEQKIEKLKDNPAIADLLKQKADIDEKIKIVEILIRDHNGTN
jgi:hypothetical protein